MVLFVPTGSFCLFRLFNWSLYLINAKFNSVIYIQPLTINYIMAENKSAKIATEVGVTKWAELPFDPKASRVELFVRIVWMFLYLIVSVVYSIVFMVIIFVFYIVASILEGIQWLVILFVGKRWQPAFDWSAKAIYERYIPYNVRLANYHVRFTPYMAWMTDKRPPLGFDASNDEYFKGIVKSAKAPKAAKAKRAKKPKAAPEEGAV